MHGPDGLSPAALATRLVVPMASWIESARLTDSVTEFVNYSLTAHDRGDSWALSRCLFLCQYRAVPMAAALSSSLSPGGVMPPASVFPSFLWL